MMRSGSAVPFKGQTNRLLMIPALLALLAAAWAGLVRMGWLLPPFQVAAHGQLMISGFFGTVIALERAVALSASFKNGRWAYAAPLLSSVGTLAVIAGLLPGAAFPLAAALVGGEAHAVGRLYGADLLGGALGAVLSAALLVPLLGLPQVCLLAAVIGLGGLLSLL
jgi:hypothetical protein